MSVNTSHHGIIVLTLTACTAALAAVVGCQAPVKTAGKPEPVAAQKTIATPVGPEEAQLREDMRRWSLDRVIAGSPTIDAYTEAELVVYADLQARSHMGRLKSEYQLTPEQEKEVRARLDELKAEYPAYWKRNQAEYSKLSGQIKQMGADRSDPAVTAQVRELISRRSRLMMGNPLYTTVVNAEIEQLLPEAQVAAVQERREKASASRLPLLRLATQNAAAGSRPTATRPASLALLRGRTSSPFSSWRMYVNLFIEAYDLDDKQQAKAESVLEELEDRRDDYQESHEQDFVALRNNRNLEARFRKGEELRAPIEKMYEELKSRLDKIPTTAQRKAAEKATETAKAAAATRPAASRPAMRILRPVGS